MESLLDIMVARADTTSMTSSAIIFRPATKADDAALRELAELDSTSVSSGDYAVAEVEGRILAAVSLSDGSAIADPFVPTAELVGLLKLHARPASGLKKPRLRLPIPRIRPRPAFA